MKKRIISIGFDIPGFDDCCYNYNSSQSLLDADIVIFEPDFSCYKQDSIHRGAPCFDKNESFTLIKNTEHWHLEISTALREGKTVFVFMSQYREIFVNTEGEEVFGIEEPAQGVARMFPYPYNNYMFLPIDIHDLIPKEGSKLIFGGDDSFVTLWNEFKNYIRYECYFDWGIEIPLFLTKTGNKPVGGLFRRGKGNLVLLPPIRYSKEEFIELDEEEGEVVWINEAIGFGKRLVKTLIDIDSSLRNSAEVSPPPNWIQEDEYRLKSETGLTEEITTISEEIKKLEQEKNTLSNKLQKEKKLKNLLFEKGKPLENVVIEALKILGYEAENYDDGNLELDQIILAPDGERYIGETEGKDNSAINIEKFRQLESNIQEDLQRENVSKPATGILFGNGFRITHPKKRVEQFTKKCISNAKRSSTILVRTSDLFKVAKYIRENNDETFAEKCRKTISESRRKIVEFPEL